MKVFKGSEQSLINFHDLEAIIKHLAPLITR